MNRRINWIVCLAMCLIVAGMMASAFLRTRDLARTMQCATNLRQLAIATHNYHTDFFKLPPAVMDHKSLPFEERLSWQASLWCYMTSMFQLRIKFDLPWRDPAHAEMRLHGMGVGELGHVGQWEFFTCPSNPFRTEPPKLGLTHYVGISGIGVDSARLPRDDPRAGIFAYEDRDVTLKYIENRDGLSTTLLIAETCHENGPWMAGGRPTARGLEQESPLPYLGRGGQFSALHFSSGRIVTNVVFADCSTRSFAESMDPKVFEALATMGGGEPVPSLED